MNNLTDIDFKILEFTNSKDCVSYNELNKHFSKISSLRYRINQLSKQKFSSSGAFSLDNSSYIVQTYLFDIKTNEEISLELYAITELGKKVLQDYKHNLKTENKKLWLKNAWIPVIVAFVTTIVTMYIVPMLPYLLRWLFDILKRIF